MASDLTRLLDHQRQRNPDSPNMKTFIITKLFQWLNSKAGGIVQWLVGVVIGWIVHTVIEGGNAWLMSHGISLPASLLVRVKLLVDHLQEVLMLAGAFAVTVAIQYLQAKWNIQLQTNLGLPPEQRDGWVGAITVKRALELKEGEG